MMNTLAYKGYMARVEFDPRDNIFWGKVLGITDGISFEGETVVELVEDFHNAIDHYLTDCAKDNRQPQKPYSGGHVGCAESAKRIIRRAGRGL